MRTIKDLLKLDGRVYLYLASTEICRQFLADAEAEGFTFGDGVRPSQKEPDTIFALNPDRTLNYVGYIGHIAFGCAEKIGSAKLLPVDYMKYSSGSDDYLIQR